MTASVGTLQFHSISLLPSKWMLEHGVFVPTALKLRREFQNLKTFKFKALHDDSLDSPRQQNKDSITNPNSRLHYSIASLPPFFSLVKRHSWSNYVMWAFVATAILGLAVRVYVVRRSMNARPGSVADLVRRGQLHSHRRGISRPLKYEDPFNNPLVKVKKENSMVQVCGKIYRLAPVTLTEEQQASHQKRRSRAYQWKRPILFLKEGESIPPDVDPDTVRWIPANHPFATIASEIDEDLAQNNVYQQHGVPFRIRAEHEALQLKLESLQQEKKLNLNIDTGNVKDFERPFKTNSTTNEFVEQTPLNQEVDESMSKSDSVPHSVSSSGSEDTQ